MFYRKEAPFLQSDLCIESLYELDYQKLYQQGIRLICLDGDHTLFDGNSKTILPETRNWLRKVQEHGLQVALLSNNFTFSARRLEDLGLASVHRFCLKPLPFIFKRVQKESGLQAGQIAMLGDQRLSDILGANLAGWTSVLLEAERAGMRPDQKIVALVENWLLNQRRKS